MKYEEHMAFSILSLHLFHTPRSYLLLTTREQHGIYEQHSGNFEGPCSTKARDFHLADPGSAQIPAISTE